MANATVMLLQYTVGNFKSIGIPITISMFPSDDSVNYQLPMTKIVDGWNVLRRAGVFGPNASGKSTVIQSLSFFRDIVINGRQSSQGTGVIPFAGKIPELEDKSIFKILFLYENIVFSYGVVLNDESILEEKLSILENKKLKPLFYRKTNAEKNTKIKIFDSFAAVDSKKRELIELLRISIKKNQSNQLFLYKLKENGIKEAEMVADWFQHLVIVSPDSKFRRLKEQLKRDEEFRNFLSKHLSSLNTGVIGIRIEELHGKILDLVEDMPIKLKEEFLEKLKRKDPKLIDSEGKKYVMKFGHRLRDEEISFDVDDESDGTRRLLDLLPILYYARKNVGGIFCIDELDRSLHTKLTQYFLHQFAVCSKEKQSQLIFTTHDVTLMKQDILQQEEIWFIEKNINGESRLFPLSDFKKREGVDRLNAYLNGRFGAIPYVGQEWEIE